MLKKYRTMPNYVIFIFIIAALLSSVTCAPTSGNVSENVNGQTLYEVGSHFNFTILKVIGSAMMNLEKDLKEQAKEICRLHPCTEWTKWSDCDVSVDNHGRVGARSRTRNCEGNTTLCERYGISTFVYDYSVCEKSFCPDDYNVTRHGFCLKYYAGPKTWDDAENVCRNDGGHLVNVDSEMKVFDMNMTLAAYPLSGNLIWIDGRKSVQGGPWAYGYESEDPTFTFWSDNDPDNGPDDLCIMYHHKPSADNNLWRWYDFPCYNKYPFVCQIQSML